MKFDSPRSNAVTSYQRFTQRSATIIEGTQGLQRHMKQLNAVRGTGDNIRSKLLGLATSLLNWWLSGIHFNPFCAFGVNFITRIRMYRESDVGVFILVTIHLYQAQNNFFISKLPTVYCARPSEHTTVLSIPFSINDSF
jgi:hypothetical protein